MPSLPSLPLPCPAQAHTQPRVGLLPHFQRKSGWNSNTVLPHLLISSSANTTTTTTQLQAQSGSHSLQYNWTTPGVWNVRVMPVFGLDFIHQREQALYHNINTDLGLFSHTFPFSDVSHVSLSVWKAISYMRAAHVRPRPGEKGPQRQSQPAEIINETVRFNQQLSYTHRIYQPSTAG